MDKEKMNARELTEKELEMVSGGTQDTPTQPTEKTIAPTTKKTEKKHK